MPALHLGIRGPRAEERPGAGIGPVALLLLLAGCVGPGRGEPPLERLRVAPDGRGFETALTGRPFTPWGFNYDHDDSGRLIEDYWEAEWPRVVDHFRAMKGLGATVVRIHLQLGRYLVSPDTPNEKTLSRLRNLLGLAEETGLYLDLTGLGCYRKSDTPDWYEKAPERERWAIQARFWEAVASACAESPAVFAYNLMNEPISPSGPGGEWHPGEPLGGYYYVEQLSKDPGKRSRIELTREWMATLTRAIRRHDPARLVTCGMFFLFEVPQGLTLGTDPREIAEGLDYLSVHLYPSDPKVDTALQLLATLAVGKPVVIEEMFPLGCSMENFRRFVKASRGTASGWIGFYWGKTLEECRRSSDLKDVFMRQWLEFFLSEGPGFKKEKP
ncbi:MAG TPA: cellulase family glycosylhydrolase [Planctomycetota bacterium]|nr:cellulase family glycosylhydrolase [Planctomycetota bacterium]